MTLIALGLVVASAFIHATWNLIAKRAEDKLAFLWCGALVTTVVFLPLGGWLLATQRVPLPGWIILAFSALLEAAYFWSLAQAYRYGDLSQVYPIARGTAPLLVPILAGVFLGEHPSPVAVAGIVVIVAGVVVLLLPSLAAREPRKLIGPVHRRGTLYAVLTGAIIASYSTLDKRGVALVAAPLYAYILFAGVTVALLPAMVTRRAAIQTQWRAHRGAVIAVGILAPLGYGLVLLALSIAPVSSVAAAREVSVVIAAVLGVVVLHEPYGRHRLFASAGITLGLGLLVTG